MNQELVNNLTAHATELGIALLKAIAVFAAGRILIRFIRKVLVARMESRKFDPTIVGYARNTLTAVMNVGLAIVLLGVLGIETTSFAALIAGAGLAIGAAWSGMLSNFAAGVFIVFLRPFKVGDHISGGGALGTVVEIGLFVTIINTEDNILTFVGNGKLLGSNVRNFSANPSRRVDMVGHIRRGADLAETFAEIRSRILKVPNVLPEPEPEIGILSFDDRSYRLVVRPYTHHDNFHQVLADGTSSLIGVLDAAGPKFAELVEEGEESEHEAAEERAEEGEEAGEEAGHEGAHAGEEKGGEEKGGEKEAE
jgi:small conductance mechanosensitive channel